MDSLPPPVPGSEEPAPRGTQVGQLLQGTRRFSAALKLVVIAVLIGVLHVPLLFIWGTLNDREGLRDEATAEMGQTWGAAQTLFGPVLAVPYTVTTRVPRPTVVGERVVQSEELRHTQGIAYFLPAHFSAEGALDVSERNRGIFRMPVYAAELALAGEFRPDTAALGLDGATFEWSRARLVLGLSDPHGLRAPPRWTRDGAEVAFAPALPRAGGWGGIEALVTGIADNAAPASLPFSISISLQGSQRIAFVPVGDANAVSLRGGWSDPSFDGAYLPVERSIDAAGFSARWETTQFGRGFPAAWSEQAGRDGPPSYSLHGHALGVTLATPVDTYRMVERSLKYAILVLTLVFAVYFLFEVTSPVRVHPLQYLMVGAALILFYLGFLALAEFVPVVVAYGGAALASIVLVGGYSWSVLRAGRRSLLVTAGLGATYGYLYFMLQLQDYALLAGTGALFALLGAVMWFTRRLDWTRLEVRSPAAG